MLMIFVEPSFLSRTLTVLPSRDVIVPVIFAFRAFPTWFVPATAIGAIAASRYRQTAGKIAKRICLPLPNFIESSRRIVITMTMGCSDDRHLKQDSLAYSPKPPAIEQSN